VAGVVNTTSPAALGMFTGRDAALINPAAPLNTLRHRRERALAIAQAASERGSVRVVAGRAAPTDIGGTVSRALANVVGSGKGHGWVCLGTV